MGDLMNGRIPAESVPAVFSGQRIAVFLDIQSLYYACKDIHGPNARIDYGSFLDYIVGERVLVRAVAYLRYNRESDTHSFHRALNGKGFEVKSKPSRDYRDRPLTWTVGMALDIVQASSKFDLAVVVTHEEEFVDALPGLISMGVPVEVWGFEPQMSSGLKQNASKFMFIPSSAVRTAAESNSSDPNSKEND